MLCLSEGSVATDDRCMHPPWSSLTAVLCASGNPCGMGGELWMVLDSGRGRLSFRCFSSQIPGPDSGSVGLQADSCSSGGSLCGDRGSQRVCGQRDEPCCAG